MKTMSHINFLVKKQHTALSASQFYCRSRACQIYELERWRNTSRVIETSLFTAPVYHTVILEQAEYLIDFIIISTYSPNVKREEWMAEENRNILLDVV